MNNILKIFKSDLRKIRHNLVAWAIIIGLLVVPCLYSWFNINASWDPYGRTGNLKIALASSDKGYQGELLSLRVNFGENLVSRVASTNKFDWVVTDEKDAIEGTKSGEYYAAVVVPEDFSKDLLSMFSDDLHRAELIYYANEKENAIAPMITLKGAKAINQQITDSFSESITEIAINAAKDLSENGTGKTASDLINKASNAVVHVKTIIDDAYYSVDSLRLATASLDSMLQSTADLATVLETTAAEGKGISKEVSKNVKNLMNDIDYEIEVLQTFLEVLQETGLDVQALIDKTTALQKDLKTLKKNLNALNDSSVKSLNQLGAIAADIRTISNQTSRTLKTLQQALGDTAELLSSSSQKMDNAIKSLDEAAKTGDTAVLKKLFSHDAADLSSFLIAPVKLDRHAVYHVENYGSSMAPFYTALAIWVGATLLVALMSVTLTEARREELDNLKHRHEYLGRYMLFGVLGIIQALLICLGDLYYLGIQCQHPLLFIFAGIYGSIVFGSIIYALVVSFGNIGKAVAVIMMIIQVAGSGGTFPIETTPIFFQKLYPFLPFPHLMDAMRETIAGMYGCTYWLELGMLTLFLMAALLLGLLLRKPVMKVTDFFSAKMKETHLM